MKLVNFVQIAKEKLITIAKVSTKENWKQLRYYAWMSVLVFHSSFLLFLLSLLKSGDKLTKQMKVRFVNKMPSDMLTDKDIMPGAGK